jgi:hypothetical protein
MAMIEEIETPSKNGRGGAYTYRSIGSASNHFRLFRLVRPRYRGRKGDYSIYSTLDIFDLDH